MRVPSVVAYGVLMLALFALYRFTSLGVDHVAEHVECGDTACAAGQPLPLARAEASPRHLLAPVVIDGNGMLFLVDTGAAATVLSREAAVELGLLGSARRILGAVNASFQIQDVLPVDRLAVGEIVFGGFELLIVDIDGIRAGLGPDVSGVLGANVLGLQPFEIDFRAPSLWLGRSESDFAASRAPGDVDSAVPLEQISGGYFVRAHADEREGFFLVDSGADSTQIGNALAANTVRVSSEAARTFDATGARTEMVRHLELDVLAVGDVMRRGLRVNVAEPSLLGADFFEDMLLRIDPDAGVLTLRGRAAEPASSGAGAPHLPRM